MIKPMWSAEAIKAYESGQGVKLVNTPHPHYEPLPEDLNPESLETVEIDLPDPWSPVSIGVDVTKKGAHVVGIYALDKDTSQVFYAKYYPVPQRTWVGLTDVEIDQGLVRTKYAMQTAGAWRDGVEWAVKQLQERNT